MIEYWRFRGYWVLGIGYRLSVTGYELRVEPNAEQGIK